MKRRVSNRFKTGGYGTTMWHHNLECGHVVSKRRRSDRDELDCIECDLFEQLPDEDPVIDPDPVEEIRSILEEPVVFDPVAGSTDVESRAVPLLASRFDIDPAAVRVFVEEGRIQGALIYVDAEMAQRIIGRS